MATSVAYLIRSPRITSDQRMRPAARYGLLPLFHPARTTSVLPPKTSEQGYHLSEDIAEDSIGWLHRHKAQPDKPSFMYWASGCLHGPHHVMKDGPTGTPANSTTAGTPTGNVFSTAPRKWAGPAVSPARNPIQLCRSAIGR